MFPYRKSYNHTAKSRKIRVLLWASRQLVENYNFISFLINRLGQTKPYWTLAHKPYLARDVLQTQAEFMNNRVNKPALAFGLSGQQGAESAITI